MTPQKKEYMRLYRIRSKDRIRKYNEIWYKKNWKAFYARHKKARRKQSALWNREHSEWKKAYDKRYFLSYKKNERRKKNMTAEQYLHYKTQNILRYKIRKGEIKRLPCEMCGNPKSQGHHSDYSKPLEIKWLCRKHHSELHRKYK